MKRTADNLIVKRIVTVKVTVVTWRTLVSSEGVPGTLISLIAEHNDGVQSASPTFVSQLKFLTGWFKHNP